MSAAAIPPAAPHPATFYQFAWPTSKSVRLEKAFLVSAPHLAEHLAIASNQRDKVLAAIVHQLPQNIVAAVDDYMPHLNGLSEQVTTSGKIALKQSLDFLWTSSLLQKVPGETRYYLYHIFPEEAAHIYFLYGLAHYALARNTQVHGYEDTARKAKSGASDAKTSDYRVEVTRLMRTAAGIFSFMAQTLLPSLSDRGSNKPPDVQIVTCKTLRDMCLCHAQELTIEGGLLKGTGEVLLAKLCAGVSEKYATARANLGRGLGNTFYSLEQGWNVFMGAKADLYAARANKLLAIAASKDSEHGKSVGYFNLALDKLKSISPPNVQGSVVELNKEVAAELADAKARHLSESTDNAKIYFALIPKDPADLPPAAPKFMISELPHKQPAAAPGPFFDQNWGIPSAAASAPAATATAAAAAPAATASAATAASGSDASWACAACTYTNTAKRITCEMCNKPRPAAADAGAGGAGAGGASPTPTMTPSATAPATASAPPAASAPPSTAPAPPGGAMPVVPSPSWQEQLNVGPTHTVKYAPTNF